MILVKKNPYGRLFFLVIFEIYLYCGKDKKIYIFYLGKDLHFKITFFGGEILERVLVESDFFNGIDFGHVAHFYVI